MRLPARHFVEVVMPYFERRGVDRELLLAVVGSADDPATGSSRGDVDPTRVAQAVCETAQDPLALVRSHLDVEPRFHQALSLLAASQETLGAALDCLHRYRAYVAAGFVLEKHEDSAGCRIRFRFEEEGVAGIVVEWLSASVLAFVLAATLRSAQVQRIRFAHEARTHRGDYTDAFGAPVYFGQGEDCIELAPESFDLRLEWVRSDPEMQRALEALVRRTLRAEGEERAVAVAPKISMAIETRLSLSKDISLSAVADDLQMTSRYLQRRLKDEGVSFRELRTESLMRRAKTLLRDTADPLSQVAESLGFANLASFSRAFRREVGIAASAYRSGLRESD